jgi:RNA polymerase-binding transcription factor
MTKRDLEGIKGKLLAERERVVESLRRNSEHTLSEIDDTTRDTCDLASASHDRGVLYQLQESDVNRLKLINEVFSRIDWDGYGMCEQYGEEIGKARLEAIQWAMNCLTCQEETDLGEPLFRDSTIKVKAQKYSAA